MRLLANFVMSALAFTACVHKTENNAQVNQKTHESGCLELEADLNYVHNTMMTDFSGLHHNEELKKSILAMFPILIEESRFCASKIDYMRTIRKYFAAFKDSHVKARWKADQIIKNIYHISTVRNAEDLNLSGLQSSATGIGITKFNENYLVTSIDRSLAGDANVKIGDALLECDNVSATRIMRDEILPYESIAVQDASEYNFAKQIFIRWDKSPGDVSQCIFQRQDKKIAAKFIWKEVNENYSTEAASTRPVYEKRVASFGHVVKVRTFAAYNSESKKILEQFVADAETLRNDRIVIIDLRGNGGGDSSYGDAWLKKLYGFSRRALSEQPTLFLSTPKNLFHLSRLFQIQNSHSADDTKPITAEQASFLACLKEHIGALVACDKAIYVSDTVSNGETSLFAGRLIALTDSHVFSSSEFFLSQIKQMPRASQAGISTDASSRYGDLRLDAVPSGRFHFSIPTKVFPEFAGSHKSGKPFVPEIELKYDIEAEISGRDSILKALEDVLSTENSDVQFRTPPK